MFMPKIIILKETFGMVFDRMNSHGKSNLKCRRNTNNILKMLFIALDSNR